MSAFLRDTRTLVRTALFISLVTVATRVIQIPVPATQGYVNIGDAVIIAGSLLLGGPMGALAGGVGSALADLLGGYSHWAPFTLVIKGLEGLLVGALAAGLGADLGRSGGVALATAASIVGVSWMVGGYFLVEWQLYSMGPALAGLAGNLAQAGASVLCGVPLAVALARSRLGQGTENDDWNRSESA